MMFLSEIVESSMKDKKLRESLRVMTDSCRQFIRKTFLMRADRGQESSQEIIALLQEHCGFSREKAEYILEAWDLQGRQPETKEALWNVLKGRWNEWRGSFWASYGEASKDEVVATEGRREVLAAVIQRTYFITQREALELVDEWACEGFGQSRVAPSG